MKIEYGITTDIDNLNNKELRIALKSALVLLNEQKREIRIWHKLNDNVFDEPDFEAGYPQPVGGDMSDMPKDRYSG